MARIRSTSNAERVYSSDEGRVRPPAAGRAAPKASTPGAAPPRDGVVRVSRTKAGRGGKTVTIVHGLPPADVQEIGKALKRVCGTGGTVKDGVVEIQGDHRERIVAHLSDRYPTKLAGG